MLLASIVDPAKVSRHYLGLARSHIMRVGSFGAQVKLKKLFYLIRPLVALDWMEQHGFAKLPPMSLPECLSQMDVPVDTGLAIRDLIDRKSRTREMGTGPIPGAIARYLEARYGHHEMNMRRVANDVARRARDRANAEAFYRKEVEAGFR
ncbi:DNA polymerase beta superfamily protein [Mesorhizobium sp. ASY16-5R]|uniref:DNA polymerase beta superfamily protein n=1 Tax=Mesorhizobium sp. ASY16-5R TaxID=3445772 RepID=UPI003F9FE0DB